MNKKIWMTGALSIAAIFITVFIYNNFIMEKTGAQEAAAAETPAESVRTEYEFETASFESLAEGGADELVYENDLYTVVFSAEDGVPVSIILNKYPSGDSEGTELIFSGSSGLHPFALRNGGFGAAEISGRYTSSVQENRAVFKGRFADADGNVFDVVKSYDFIPGSYGFRFNLKIGAASGSLPIGDGAYLYSLEMGPQLGPEISSFDRGYSYRYFCLNDDGEKRNIGTPEDKKSLSLETPYGWLGVEGRYFAGITVPSFNYFSPAWDEREVGGLFKRNAYFIQRKAGTGGASAAIDDDYFIYFGPKDRKILEKSSEAASLLPGISNPNLELLSSQGGVISALSTAIKAVLVLIHRLIPNYGAVIIVFTLLIQALIFPISRRTYDNAVRMQLLGTELAALKKKYKYNNAKMSEESMKLFEANNVRPRSSMLPFIIHLPFFVLTYVLLLTNIEFRLQPFIPGWIPDVSIPEYLVSIAPAKIPITGWDRIRLLPVIALAVSLIQSRYIQAPADSARSMRIMSYLIPVVMFLVIYNMPSGAVLYWLTMISTNLLIQWRIKSIYAGKK